MHPSALELGGLFFSTYLPGPQPGVTVVDLGSQDVSGSLRQHQPAQSRYIGVDFVQARGVDVVLQDPYSLPFDDASIDCIVCSSVLEHSELFWVLFLELMRVLRPAGLLYLNVPANGAIHRYPVDCWRFYPDSGKALVTWARRSGYQPLLLETFTAYQKADIWNDVVSVFLKDEAQLGLHPRRLLDSFTDFYCGWRLGAGDAWLNHRDAPEDMSRLMAIASIAQGRLGIR